MSPTPRTPRNGSARRRRRRTRCYRSTRPASSTTATATRGSAPAATCRPTSAASRICSAPSSGTTSWGGPAAPTCGPRRRHPRRGRDRARGRRARCRGRSVPVAVTCATCSGSGAEPDPTGNVPLRRRRTAQSISSSAFGQFIRTATCPECGGAGRVIAKHCPDCGGAGRVSGRNLDVEIPPGIHDGQRIRLSGEESCRDARRPARRRLRSRPDRFQGERFVRDGNDIVSTVDLTISQAALGTTLAVPTLGGEVEVGFDPGTQAGEIRTLRGKECPCSRASAAAITGSLSTCSCRATSPRSSAVCSRSSRARATRNYGGDEEFLDKIRAAFR